MTLISGLILGLGVSRGPGSREPPASASCVVPLTTQETTSERHRFSRPSWGGMGVCEVVTALETQDDQLAAALAFSERIPLAVDDAYTGFTQAKVAGLLKRGPCAILLRTYEPWTWSTRVAWAARSSPDWAPAASSPPTAALCCEGSPDRGNLTWHQQSPRPPARTATGPT